MTDIDASHDVTRILQHARAGDPAALDRVLPLVYDELRRVARRHLRRERADHTLDTGALVHEAWFKLVDQTQVPAETRPHFLAIAARAMRQVLVDHARRRGAAKRGGDWARTTLHADRLGAPTDIEELVVLNDALDRLEGVEPRWRQVVECRFFGGMTNEDIGQVLGVTARTVERDWVKAKAWLYKELYPDAG